MAQTMTEKIFSEHAGREVKAGEIVRVNIDMIIGNDITTPISIKAFEESGAETLAHPDGFALVMVDVESRRAYPLFTKQLKREKKKVVEPKEKSL